MSSPHPQPPPLEYASPLTPGAPGSDPTIEQSDAELIVTVPAGRLWTLLLGRGLLVTLGATVSMSVGLPTLRELMFGGFRAELLCLVSALLGLVGLTWIALDAFIRAARYGGSPAILRASAGSLIISHASDRRPTRRWAREQIAYVMVDRSLTAGLRFMVTVSVITSDGGKDSGIDISTRDGSMHRKLEHLINQYLGITLPLPDAWRPPGTLTAR